MRKVLCLIIMLCISFSVLAQEVDYENFTMTTSGEYYDDNESLLFSEELSETTTVSFGNDSDMYIIDADGFRSCSYDEVMRISAAILLYSAGGWYADDLSMVIFETFIPERFKVVEKE